MARRSGDVPLFVWQVVLALAAAALGGVAAVLPLLRDENGLSSATVGLIAASGFFAAFVGQGVIAPRGERWQRRQLILAGLSLTVLGLVGMAIGETGSQLVAARIAIGLGTGVVVPTIRAAVAVSDPDHVAENQGRLVVGEMAGFIVGPAATAVLADVLGLELAFLALAALLAAFLPLVLGLPESPSLPDPGPRESQLGLLRRPRLRGAIVMIGGYALGLGAFEAVLPLQLADEGVSTAGIGLFFTALVVPIALSSAIGGRVADRTGPWRVATVGMIAGSILVMFLGLVPSVWWIAVLLAAAGIADGFGFTASLALASQSVSADRQATALGMVGASQVLFAGLGAVPASLLFDIYGAGSAWLAIGGAMTLFVATGAAISRRDPIKSNHGPVESVTDNSIKTKEPGCVK